jgi:hypothetical protein
MMIIGKKHFLFLESASFKVLEKKHLNDIGYLLGT